MNSRTYALIYFRAKKRYSIKGTAKVIVEEFKVLYEYYVICKTMTGVHTHDFGLANNIYDSKGIIIIK